MAAAAEERGPVEQSIAIGFRVLGGAVLALALAALAANWRPVPADSQVVVRSWGRVTGVQGAGLVLSWPRPIGQVDLVPGPERLLLVDTDTTAQLGGLEDLITAAGGMAVAPGTGSYLTGDGGVVLLRATIAYRVSDAAAFLLAKDHVEPALRRIFTAAAVGVTAGRMLDDVLVTRPETGSGEARRQALRGDLAAAVNARLESLERDGAGLGVRVARIDAEASLPPAAKIAFDAVLVAGQTAEAGIAAARTEAERVGQTAGREADRLLSAARAAAAERVGEARARAAPTLAIAAGLRPETRAGVLDQLYREGMARLLPRVGRLTAVDPADAGRLILPAGTAP